MIRNVTPETKKVSTATPSNNWAESLEEESSWVITQQDVPDTRGFHNEQTFTTPTYLESMEEEVEELEAMCFLVSDTTGLIRMEYHVLGSNSGSCYTYIATYWINFGLFLFRNGFTINR